MNLNLNLYARKAVQMPALTLLLCTAGPAQAQQRPPSDTHQGANTMLIRMSEIQIKPESLQEYTAILREEAAASVSREPGVISIFPMTQKDKPTEIRILEIYASQAAYEAHLKTPHFLTYKTQTADMVQSLKLIDMQAVDPHSLPAIFKKQ